MKANLKVTNKNPLDVSTIISIYPIGFTEKKAMMPEWYHIDKGSYENPSYTPVTGGSSFRLMADTNQTIEIPISSISVAESVVRDWMVGIIEFVPGVAQPGVFYLPGNWDHKKLLADPEAKKVLDYIDQLQKAWFMKLIDLGDALWSRANGNPRVVSDLMRTAAGIMQIKDKPWMANFTTARMTNCPACGTLCLPGFPVCANCKHVIDPAAYSKLQPTAAVK